MNLTLFDRNTALCEEWGKRFEGCPQVKVVHSNLEALAPHNYLITAGNSYGIMDGGIDLVVRSMLGIQVQDYLQWRIVQDYNGKLPVGKALIIPLKQQRFEYLVYAPTMSFPQHIPPLNVFMAFYSALDSILQGAQDQSVACCGLGALTGGVPSQIVANEMYKAYKKVIDIYGEC